MGSLARCLPPSLGHVLGLGTRKPFDTIQGAVDAARPGATIWVCPGVYEETVKVQKPRLTLKGANAGRDATRSGRHRESVVRHPEPGASQATVQLLEDDITWDGFTIVGNAGAQNGPGMVTSELHSGYLIRDTIFVDNGVGLDLGANGEHPSYVCRNRFVANDEVEPGGRLRRLLRAGRPAGPDHLQPVPGPQRRRHPLHRPGPHPAGPADRPQPERQRPELRHPLQHLPGAGDLQQRHRPRR